jgi:hypothetical protein
MDMALMLDLPPELEQRLAQQAARRGIPADEYAVQILERHLPAEDPRAELVTLLQSWIDDDDAEEQKETGDYLVRALDQDRMSARKLFPPELEGVTW